MIPIDAHLKMCLESMFVVVLLTYALRSIWLRVHHLSAGAALLLSAPLAIDIVYFHCVRSPQAWAALNVPFLAVVIAFCYVRIGKKSSGKLRRKLAILATLLCRE